MKKIISLLFSVLFLFSLASCKGGNRSGYDTIEYGRFPIEIVSSKEIIDQLNELKDESKNEYGYFEIDGVEYDKVIANPSGTEELYFSDNSPVKAGKAFYFIVKPIKWRLLSQEGNVKTLISDNILNCIDYLKEESKHRYDDSNLREYLNTVFLENAFSKETKKPLSTKISVSNIYGDDKTEVEDKVWIPSYLEIMDSTNFKSDDDRYAFATDYAKAVGSIVFFDSPNSYYYNASPYPLRTISLINDTSIFYVDFYGKITSVNNKDYFKNVSLRPCIRIEA